MEPRLKLAARQLLGARRYRLSYGIVNDTSVGITMAGLYVRTFFILIISVTFVKFCFHQRFLFVFVCLFVSRVTPTA